MHAQYYDDDPEIDIFLKIIFKNCAWNVNLKNSFTLHAL